MRLGASVRAILQISLHKKDLALLEKLRDFFEVGRVAMRSDDAVVYEVSSLKDLQIILKHLEAYTLITDKGVDIKLFKKVVELMKDQENLNLKGLAKIVNIKASMNFVTIYE